MKSALAAAIIFLCFALHIAFAHVKTEIEKHEKTIAEQQEQINRLTARLAEHTVGHPRDCWDIVVPKP